MIYITVGSGGGIAGIETSFHVLPNGAVYHTSSLDTLQKKLPPINRKVVRAALEKGRQLMDYAYQKPGNVYKFITLHIAGRANRIAWHEEAEVDARCLEAYKTIDKLINKSQL